MELIPINERIVELDSGLDGAGAAIGDFASQISSGISSMDTNPPDRRIWKDIVCARVTNIANSTASLLDSKAREAAEVSAAAAVVDALETACSDYVAAYPPYKAAVEAYNAEFENKSPPEDEGEKAEWERRKADAEANCEALKSAVLSCEETALSQEAAVKSSFSGSASSAGGLTGNYGAVEVTGAEFEQFCEKNYIDSSRAIVKKAVVEINGANYDVYYVYDKLLEDFDNMAFEVYANESIRQLEEKVNDGELVKNLSNTYLIMQQDYALDIGGAQEHHAQAWYMSSTNEITLWFPDRSLYDFGTASLVHEFGHAVDSYVGRKEGSTMGLSSESIDFDRWIQLVKKEGSWAGDISTFPFLSPAYTVNYFTKERGKYLPEYVAEAFNMYFYSDETKAYLEKYAHETYLEVEKLIGRAKSKTNRG